MYKTILILTAVGALNWGLIALFNFNLVTALFGVDTLLTNAVYLVVAASAIVVVALGFMPEQSTNQQRSAA
jgi:hypothetical protein